VFLGDEQIISDAPPVDGRERVATPAVGWIWPIAARNDHLDGKIAKGFDFSTDTTCQRPSLG
jgi:hypothetical protein